MHTFLAAAVLVAFLSEVSPEEPGVQDAPGAAFQMLVESNGWRERMYAAERLTSLGDAALPYLIAGTRHESSAVRHECYRVLFERDPGNRSAVDEAVIRGLDDETGSIRYMCASFAGRARIAPAEPKLREILKESQDNHIGAAAAKSLAELGEADAFPVLYAFAATGNRYAVRRDANTGLKALSGRNLSDFAGYDYREGASLISGSEVVVLVDPLTDARRKAKRYAALAEFCKWLRDERPDLHAELYAERRRNHYSGAGAAEDSGHDTTRQKP